ncbi:Manganese superoxide dismutase [Mycena sanguinolenta]|uniref:Manganese superoxide dismutase n=1 Tax=Mycena sanguinolenta TaxID=230812 RepID=A0A8H7D183_9AGAR|nr:Manganese superoxide dismutase [Mycena sanguinolenta]
MAWVNFYPPPALEAVAMEYQLGLLARLTDEVRRKNPAASELYFQQLKTNFCLYTDTPNEDDSVTQIIISTAPFREKTLAFNYASLALNNSFFLGQLTPDAFHSQEAAVSETLYKQIGADYGGLEQLKSTFSAAAMGMFTSGCVWFVTDKYGSTSILPTFGPGTLLVRSRTYAATNLPNLYHEMPSNPFAWDRSERYIAKYLSEWGVDGRGGAPPLLNPQDLGKLFGDNDDAPPPPPKWNAGVPFGTRSLHTSATRKAENWSESRPATIQTATSDPTPLSSKVDALHTGEVLYPLFCISVQEHAWLSAGYGIWGKEGWLREFWNVLNWQQVSQSYDYITKTTK